MQVIAIANEKGGTGKTTTAVNVSAALGLAGYQVVVIDLDSQAHATEWLGLSKSGITPEQSSYGVLTGATEIVDALHPTTEQQVRVCPGHAMLVKAPMELSTNVDGLFVLRDALHQAAESSEQIDYVVIDCPGAIGPLVYNALIAAHLVIAPVLSELLSIEGLGELTETVRRVKARHSPQLPPPVILINNYEGRSTTDRQIQSGLREQFGRSVFNTCIGRDAPLREAFGSQESIFRYRRSARSATAFRDLAAEIVERLNG
ncbi:MAG TPA: ParA family protein [Herpetosiphonaceae bacterium]